MATVESYVLDLAGLSLTPIQIDFRFTLNFEGKGSVSLSCPFEYSEAARRTILLDPDGPKAKLLPAIELFGKVVRKAFVVGATLTIEFEHGVRLIARADDDYEAWTFDDLEPAPNNRKIICLPGGGVAVWGEFAPYRRGK